MNPYEWFVVLYTQIRDLVSIWPGEVILGDLCSFLFGHGVEPAVYVVSNIGPYLQYLGSLALLLEQF